MHYQTIKKLQRDNGYTELQQSINDGSVWKLNGSSGRGAMDSLESGVCMLPKKTTSDYYGNTLPSRDVLKSGTKGSFQNSVNFWVSFEDKFHASF